MPNQPRRPDLKPPHAKRQPVTSEHHGITLTDDYAWLRAENWQEVMRDPNLLASEIRTHLEAENAYTKAALSETEPLQAALFEEMKARLKQDDRTVPAPDGPFEYYSRYVPGGQYPLVCRHPRGTTDEQVLLDGNKEADGKAYWGFGGDQQSPNHRLLAYAVDDKGSELYTIRIRDLETGQDLPDVITDTKGDFVWANDSQTLFYIRLDANHRPLFVYRHKLGTANEQDELIYEEKDIAFYVGLSKTQSGKFILIDAHDHTTSEIRIIDADAASTPPRLIAARVPQHQYDVEHEGSRLIIITNSDGAVDFRICDAPLSDPGPDHWREIVAHKPGRLILSSVAFDKHLIRLERENGLPRIVITSLLDNREHEIAFDEEAYALGIAPGFEFETTTLRFVYSSMTTPSETYDYDMVTRARTLRKRQEVPSGHNPEDYVTRRFLAPAHDGEQVPVSVLYHKDTPLDGTAPVYLYGYGAYGISIPSSFSTARFSLVDRGFIFALAHIRGGKDKGYQWYLDGKLKKKTNTFHDFISAGNDLINRGLTSRGNIVAYGGSAGGMLMGAIANMEPDLFLGIVADVPFVDVLNTMLDKDLPLTPPEWLEWGNPIADREEFDTIHSYSPYENVDAKKYPHIFAYGGLTDPRVTYWEPAKWIAKLRELNTSENLVLLKTNMDAGHSGASGRYEALREVAMDYAFALLISGKLDPVPPTS